MLNELTELPNNPLILWKWYNSICIIIVGGVCNLLSGGGVKGWGVGRGHVSENHLLASFDKGSCIS